MEIPEDVLREERLLTPRETAEEEEWDRAFLERRKQIKQAEKTSRERRAKSAKKLRDLESRWRRLEDRRIDKFNEYLERVTSSLSSNQDRNQT